MGTRFGTALRSGENSERVGHDVAAAAVAQSGAKNVDFVLLFSSMGYDIGAVLRGVRQVVGAAPVLGCSTAASFTEEKVDSNAVACAVVSSDTHLFKVGFGEGLRADENRCFRVASETLLARPAMEHRSLFIVMDGLAGKGEEVSLLPLEFFGPEVSVAGGSAADNYAFKETLVIANDRVAADAVAIATIDSSRPLAIGVKHGHSPISQPFKVTKAEANKVFELDGRPAVEVWLENSREAAKAFGIDVDAMWEDPAQLGRFTCIFEGGLDTGGDYKIRWSGLTGATRDHLPFACTIPVGASMAIMQGTPETQIESARLAVKEALAAARGKIAGALIFDCAVRGAIMGDQFPKALAEIRGLLPGIPVIGAETYGEVGLQPGQLSGFHNTTSVVVLLPD